MWAGGEVGRWHLADVPGAEDAQEGEEDHRQEGGHLGTGIPSSLGFLKVPTLFT